jgi:hypothetical protein
MHPPATQTFPLGHVLFVQGGTQRCSTQTLPPLHCELVVQGEGLPVQTPLLVSQEKPVGQGVFPLQPGVQTPSTHW